MRATAPARCRRSGRSAAGSRAIPRVGVGVERAVALDLVGQQGPALRRHRAREREVDPEALHVLLRQVDPAAVEVLVDVADEVGQLEGQSQGAGGLLGGRVGRLQHREHHLPDHRSGPLHVAAEVVPGLVAAGVRSMAMAPKNRSKHSGSMPGRPHGGGRSRRAPGRRLRPGLLGRDGAEAVGEPQRGRGAGVAAVDPAWADRRCRRPAGRGRRWRTRACAGAEAAGPRPRSTSCRSARSAGRTRGSRPQQGRAASSAGARGAAHRVGSGR